MADHSPFDKLGEERNPRHSGDVTDWRPAPYLLNSAMAPKLSEALHTWQEAEAHARHLDQSLASAVSRLDLVEAERVAWELRHQRSYAGEMLTTTLRLLADWKEGP